MSNKSSLTPAGYSGTPLARKLGIKPGSRLFVAGAPPDYKKLIAPLPEKSREGPDRHHRGHDPRSGAAARAGRYQSVRGR